MFHAPNARGQLPTHLPARSPRAGALPIRLWRLWGLSAEVSILHQFLEWGQVQPPDLGHLGRLAPPLMVPPVRDSDSRDERPGFWVFELGSHRALSNEPIVTWQ